MPRPPFFEIRDRLLPQPHLTAPCAGYEAGAWRCDQLVDHLMDSLPEFALRFSEFEGIDGTNARRQLRKAADIVYNTDKYGRRGEFGELLLHVVLTEVFSTLPAISKLYYKDSSNDTIKGFDAVHVVPNGPDLELWLGEVKFYSDISQAISDVIKELHKHTNLDYVRSEFLLVANKIDDAWPHSAALRRLLDPNTSLDTVFARTCIPVLLTYDSRTIASHTAVSHAFTQAFIAEVRKHHSTFASKALPPHVRVHLILLPLWEKKELVRKLHERLKKWQNL